MPFLLANARVRAICSLCLVMATGCSSARGRTAVTPADVDPWGAVIAIAPGSRIEVISDSGAVERGELTAADESGLILKSGPDPPRRILRSRVLEVTLIEHGRDSLKNGTIIGAAIGVAYVAVVASILSKGDDSLDGDQLVGGFTAMAGLGAAIGAGIDRMREGERRKVIFRRP